MIQVGIAGIGFMGMIHYLAYQKVRGVKVRALCEQDQKRLAGDWRSIQGNFGPRGTMMDLGGIDRYAKLDEMIADPSLDVIDVCLPPSLHAEVSIAALKAGKHVFCEKPIALKPADAARMVRTAERAGKQLMIGQVLPFFPEYKFAYRTITGGKYGKLLGGHFKRIISDPLWLPDFYNPESTGGPMLDLHVHDAHYIRVIAGLPKSVQSVGSMRGEVVERFSTQFRFDDPKLVITATSGVIDQQGRSFTHAYEIYLEKATLLFDAAGIGKDWVVGYPVTVLTDKGRVLRPKLGSGDPCDAFADEIREMVRTVAANAPSKLLAGALACDAVLLCQKQTQSVQTGRTVKV
ncbi:MAG: Gfo/Idh/MocA family oxidoreductase [Pirellulales bacterium]|nr:Gfo/Idh/MocA family oxidoreductase [Pirellulales bacterium]